MVGQLGLFYTTLISGADRIMVPNSVVIGCAVIPLREPDRVELRARLDAGTSPRQVQETLEDRITVRLLYPPHVVVEELDSDEVVARIVSTPSNPADGAQLAEEVDEAVRSAAAAPATGNGNGNGR